MNMENIVNEFFANHLKCMNEESFEAIKNGWLEFCDYWFEWAENEVLSDVEGCGNIMGYSKYLEQLLDNCESLEDLKEIHFKELVPPISGKDNPRQLYEWLLTFKEYLGINEDIAKAMVGLILLREALNKIDEYDEEDLEGNEDIVEKEIIKWIEELMNLWQRKVQSLPRTLKDK